MRAHVYVYDAHLFSFINTHRTWPHVDSPAAVQSRHPPLSIVTDPLPNPTHTHPPPLNQDFSRHLQRKTIGQHICVLTSLRDPLHFPVKFL